MNDNIVTLAMLERLNISEHLLDPFLRRGVVQRLHPGVFLIGAAPPTWEQTLRAAVHAAGEHAVVLSHQTLAAANAVDGAVRGIIELTVCDDRDIDLAGVRIYRSRRGLGQVFVRDGLPHGSLERMLVDYAASTDDRLLVERAVEDVLNRRLTTEERVWRGLIQHGGRGVEGSRLLREVLLRRPKGRPAKRLLEILVGHVLDDVGIPGIRNYPVTVGGERFEIDRAYPDARVALEADSKKFHSTATAVGRDRVRQEKLEAVGWFFVRTDWTEVVRQPEVLVTRLVAAVARRSAA